MEPSIDEIFDAMGVLSRAGKVKATYSFINDADGSRQLSDGSPDAYSVRLAALDRAVSALSVSPTENPRSRTGSIIQMARRFEDYLLGVEMTTGEHKRPTQSGGGMTRDNTTTMAPAGPPYLYGEPTPPAEESLDKLREKLGTYPYDEPED